MGSATIDVTRRTPAIGAAHAAEVPPTVGALPTLNPTPLPHARLGSGFVHHRGDFGRDVLLTGAPVASRAIATSCRRASTSTSPSVVLMKHSAAPRRARCGAALGQPCALMH